MTGQEVREKYLKFFKGSPRNHKEIKPAPLVLEDDPTTLFTSAGMQPLVPYLLGRKHPKGKRLTDSQPAVRLGDIEEVGDNRHNTFFEMLGNWSLGDYFKEEQLPWVWDYFTTELKLNPKRLYVTVYKGEEEFGVARDGESVTIWKEIFKKAGIDAKDVNNVEENGMQGGRIFYYSDNWWSMTGSPKQMNVGHIGGPDSEVFYEFVDVKHEPKYGKVCHPNDDCGRFLEIGNSVFIQYKKVSDKKLEELPQKNVDFGGGLERITAAVNNDPDIFKTDFFEGIIKEVEEKYDVTFGKSEDTDRSLRIIADHSRAATALISSGIVPSNKLHGYILRRLIRRLLLHLYSVSPNKSISVPIVDLGKFGVPMDLKTVKEVELILTGETEKFARVMKRGVKILESIAKSEKEVTGEVAFNLYQSYGFPLELTLEFLERNGLKFTQQDRKDFEKEFEKHKDLSRTTSAGVFKGGLADHSPEVVRLHTATHLLLASLRKVLGEHVVQKGQNITKDRSRFDFPNPEKLTDAQFKSVENMINDIIRKDLPVNFKVMSKDDALKTGAIHAFNEKYADTVKVYYVGEDFNSAFSKEFCGGPHVSSTSLIGRVRIKKQEKIGAGLVRIYLAIA